MVAQCLGPPELCEAVHAQLVVTRRNSTTGQPYTVNETFAVACRPKREPDVEYYNDYDPDYTQDDLMH